MRDTDMLLDAADHAAQSAPNEQERQPSSSEEVVARRAAIVEHLDADIIVYSGGITFGSDRRVLEVLDQTPDHLRKDTGILWLSTLGGLPDNAYTIARAFQRRYKQFKVLVTGFCKSSGTLVALGASDLVMSDSGQLGPLDIQVMDKEEFGERLSGLNPSEALRAINFQAVEMLKEQFFELRIRHRLSTKQALEVATNLTGQLMSPVTNQLDLIKYGEFIRAMRIAEDYGQRLTEHWEAANLKDNAINLLTTGYPSHGFAIDREEAEKALFSSVSEPCEALNVLIGELGPVIDRRSLSDNNAPFVANLNHAFGMYAEGASSSDHQEHPNGGGKHDGDNGEENDEAEQEPR